MSVIKTIILRDAKPENILYADVLGSDNQFQFQLDDFGLCNRVINARTFAETQIYMAPGNVLERRANM